MARDKHRVNDITYQKLRFFKHLRIFVFALIGVIWANFCGFIDAEIILKPIFIWMIIVGIHYAKVFGTDAIERWITNKWELDIMKKEYEKAGREEVPDQLDLNELKSYYKNNPSKGSSKSKVYSWDEGEIV